MSISSFDYQCQHQSQLDLTLSARWMLVSAQLNHQQQNLECLLVVDFKDGSRSSYPLPVTFKGRLYEVFYLEKPATRLLVEFHSQGEITFTSPLSIKRIGFLSAWYIMQRRLLHTPKWQKSALSIGKLDQLFNTFKAYRLSANTRYYMPSPGYDEWIKLNENFSNPVKQRLERFFAEKADFLPKLHIIIDARYNTNTQDINSTLASISHQLTVTPKVFLLANNTDVATLQQGLDSNIVITDISRLRSLVEQGENAWFYLLQPGITISPWALAWVSTSAWHHKAKIIYSDHDQLVNGRRIEPCFKPDWSATFAQSSGYLGSAFAIQSELFLRTLDEDGFQTAYQLMLDATSHVKDEQIYHITAILYHSSASESSAAPQQELLNAHLKKKGIAAAVSKDGDFLRVQYRLPSPRPLVSILVPTRDALRYLKTSIDSVLEKTSWPSYEIIILDNQSSDPATLAYMKKVEANPKVRVLRYDHPFNFSSINNFGARHARGDIICLLNNDTEVISPDWLEEMVSRLLQPGVGVVGARLYFSDGRVQHAGDVLGPGGCATHLHGILDADDPGYMHRAVLPQDLSAVTAACFVTRRSLFEQLGGLDEEHLPVAFNDVDYCLRVREAGWKVIYTPYAELYHHESVSRGKDDSPEKMARAKRESDYMRKRWGHIIERDPFYNPNLNYSRADFSLGKVPRQKWPW